MNGSWWFAVGDVSHHGVIAGGKDISGGRIVGFSVETDLTKSEAIRTLLRHGFEYERIENGTSFG